MNIPYTIALSDKIYTHAQHILTTFFKKEIKWLQSRDINFLCEGSRMKYSFINFLLQEEMIKEN